MWTLGHLQRSRHAKSRALAPLAPSDDVTRLLYPPTICDHAGVWNSC